MAGNLTHTSQLPVFLQSVNNSFLPSPVCQGFWTVGYSGYMVQTVIAISRKLERFRVNVTPLPLFLPL